MRRVSFKISRKGTHYHSKVKPNPNPLLVFLDDDDEVDATTSIFEPHHHQLIPARVQCDNDFARKRSVIDLTEDDDDEDTDDIADADVSFVVNIFPDGYTIDKSLASIDALRIAIMYDPKFLHPYDRASKSLFAAIECCQVPANFFDDIPCVYKEGRVACEVRDWRKDSSESAGVAINGLSVAATPSVRRISLKMSADSIVSDITQMSKRNFWAYSELMEAEAKILLALNPKLDLDPYPNFDRLCKKPPTVKLNLDFRAMRRKRLRQTSLPEKSNLGTDNSKPMMDQPNVVNLATQSANQRPAMGPPNSVNLATQNAGRIPIVHPLTQILRQIPTVRPFTQNVCQLPTLNKLTQNVRQLPTKHHLNQNVRQLTTMDPLTQNARQLQTMDQLKQNVGQRPGPNVVNLATQNVGQWNTTVSSPINHAPNTSILRFPWESHQPKDQFGVQTPGNMQSQAPGTAFNAPGVSSTHALVNLSSDNDDINSFMSDFEGRRGNQDNQSFSLANSDHRNRSNPSSFVGNQQQKLASHNDLGASSSTPGASFTHAMQSSSSLMSAFDSRRGNHGRQASSMANSNNRIWKDPFGLPGNHQQMTLENLDNTPGTAFNPLRASNTPSKSLLSANDGRRFRKASLDGRRRSNSLVLLGNQQQQLASNMQNNAARTSVIAPGGSSTHGMANLNSNNGGISSIIPSDGNKGNQDGNSSSLVNMDNSNWSHQHQQIPLHNQNTSATAFNAAGASSSHGMVNLNSNNDDISSVIPFDNSSSIANLNSGNQSNPLVNIGYQQPKIEPQMLDNAQGTAVGVSRASPTHSMMDFTSDDIDWSSIWSGLDNTSENQDGQSSIMANADNRNQSNPLAIVGNQQQQIPSYMQNNTSQTNANVPEASSAQGAVNLSSGDNGILANNADNNHSNPLAFVEFDDYDHLLEEELLPSSPNNMENEGYTIQGDEIQTKPLSVVQLSDSPVAIAGNNPVSSIGQDLSLQQRLYFNRTVNNPVSQKQQSQRRQGNIMAPGNVIGTALNIGGENSMVGVGQGSPNSSRTGIPRSGSKGVSPLAIINPKPMEMNQGSIRDIKPRAAQRSPSVSGISRGQSGNTGGSQGGDSQTPSSTGSGSRGRGSRGRGSRGRGSRGRGSRGRASRGRGSRGEGSDNALDNYVNPTERNDVGQLPRMALSKPNVLTEFGEQSNNSRVVRIANMNIDDSLILGSASAGSGSAGSGSHGRATDRIHMQRNATASHRSMSHMNQNQMQQQTNLQPALVSTSVSSGPSASATNQGRGSSRSTDWIDDEFMRNMLK